MLVVLTAPILAQVRGEYQVKAAFLLNFTKFIDWRPSAFESAESPLSICILGADPFGGVIDRLVEGETAAGRRVVVERLQQPPRPRSCQVLFLSKSEKDAASVLSTVGPGVLTVSDRDRFLVEGGMIALVVDNQHVRFDVNQRAAVRASVIINARMLNVARSVER